MYEVISLQVHTGLTTGAVRYINFEHDPQPETKRFVSILNICFII